MDRRTSTRPPQNHNQITQVSTGRLFAMPKSRLKPTLLVAAATIPAILILAAFINAWGGLVPPKFQQALIDDQFSHADTQRINLATPTFILVQIGIISVFFAGYVWPRIKRFDRVLINRVIAAAFLAGSASILIPTTFSVTEGRYGGWWRLALLTPSVANTSPTIVVLAMLGAAATTTLALAIPYRARWLAITALGAFTAAQTANANAWQRYHEPLLLMGIAVIAIHALYFTTNPTPTANASHKPRTPRSLGTAIDDAMNLWKWVGPPALTAVLVFTSTKISWENAPQTGFIPPQYRSSIQIQPPQLTSSELLFHTASKTDRINQDQPNQHIGIHVSKLTCIHTKGVINSDM